MANNTPLLDLPVEILLSIFPYLDANSFLALTSTCKSLHRPEFLHESTFWSSIVRTTFRVPNQPVVENDGQRWQKLYKRLLTQSRVMTWGDNQKACLGHSYTSPAAGFRIRGGPPHRGRPRAIRQKHISWPQKMDETESLGVISDLQCGGWSTSLLTSKGAIYTVGVLDGLQLNRPRAPAYQQPKMFPTPLRFPSGFVQPSERYDAATAIKQFSSGRGHVLGLSDSGRIWTWRNVDEAGLHVRFIHHETVEGERASGNGVVKKVVAGWNKSAALIEGSGIVLWEPLERENDESATEDAALVLESAAVPRTGYRESKANRQRTAEEDELAETVGQVLNYIVLEHVVLFNTSLGKVFVSEIVWNQEEQRLGDPIELPLTTSTDLDEAFATDIQGSFRSFAVFTRSGAVLTGHQDRVMNYLQATGSQPESLFTRIPALQHKNVISVAFGDYHFHALHSQGYITSYGNEPQACGALGLGGHGDPEGRLRGIRYAGMGGDGRLVPHAYTEGRRVWFEEEKHQWIRFLTSGGTDPEEAAERLRMAIGSPDLACQGEVSEWIEQEGRDWEAKYGLQGEDEDGLGAYFALSVTAAGWHSGALVLANDELAQKISRACEVPDPKAAKSPGADNEPASATADGAGHSEQVSTPPSSSSPFTTSPLLTTALDYARWFLGVGPYSAPTHSNNNAQSQPPTSAIHVDPAVATGARPPRRTPEPMDYGASPREGVKYAWAGDAFPRLRLSDGREMPGEVGFAEWRYGRPEWELGESF